MSNGYCVRFECAGHAAEPLVGDLWPGETDAAFGYPCSDAGTRPIEVRDALIALVNDVDWDDYDHCPIVDRMVAEALRDIDPPQEHAAYVESNLHTSVMGWLEARQ